MRLSDRRKNPISTGDVPSRQMVGASMNSTLRNDLARALRNNRYERTEDGRIFMPGPKVFVGGSFRSDVNGKDVHLLPNLFTAEGLTYVLGASFQGLSQATAFYLAPFSGDVTPDGTLTASNFTSRQTEFTQYTQATRVAWTPPAPPITTPEIDNSAALATFTNNLANATVWGFAMLTAAPKSATTGTCISCFIEPTPRSNLLVGDELNLQYSITAVDAG
jgi:hypothetical protein